MFGFFVLNILFNISNDLSPEILIIPIPPSPLGGDIAAIVSNLRDRFVTVFIFFRSVVFVSY